jgi:hypothetical protein
MRILEPDECLNSVPATVYIWPNLFEQYRTIDNMQTSEMQKIYIQKYDSIISRFIFIFHKSIYKNWRNNDMASCNFQME